MKLIEGKCFHQNPNIFYTKHSSTHLLYPHITFFVTHSTFLFMHSPIIRVIIYFGKIIINIIVLWKEKKDMYYFWKESHCLME